MPTPGPWSKNIFARYYARFGEWPKGLFLILQGDPVPVDLVSAGDRLRKVFLTEEAKRELYEELNPMPRKTVTWATEDGETVTLTAYEPREAEG